MPIRTVVSALLLVLALGFRNQAFPDTLSSCTLNADGFTQTCDLFEVAETSGSVSLVNPVTAGFVVLLEPDLKTWSDVVWFPDDGTGLASIVELFSDPFDFAVLPFKESDVAAQAAFVPELPTKPTTFRVSTFGFEDTFRVFSADVPEPCTLVLVFPVFIIIGLANRKHAACASNKRLVS